MKMQVLYRLTSVAATVGYNAVSSLKSRLLGDNGDHLEYMGHESAVFSRNAVCRLDMTLWNNENVNGSLGIYVVESQTLIVLVSLLGGDNALDYFAE